MAPRGPYRPQGRKYEAILAGIREIAREDKWEGVQGGADRYTRSDYRAAYIEAYATAEQVAATHVP